METIHFRDVTSELAKITSVEVNYHSRKHGLSKPWQTPHLSTMSLLIGQVKAVKAVQNQ